MKITIQAPENLSEITLRQYQDFLAIDEPQTEDVLRVFLRLSDQVIDKIPKSKVESISSHIMKLFEKKPGLVKIFNYGNRRWGFIPNIDAITWGENRDASKYLSGENWKDMHNAMAVFFRPILSEKKPKYLIDDYEGSYKYADELNDMPLSIAMGAYFFLLNLQNDLLRATPTYILNQLSETDLQKRVSLQNGETTTNSTHSVKEILDALTRLPDIPSIGV